MVGCGWRSQFYLRAAQMLPEQLEILSIIVKNPERAREVRERTGIPAVCTLEEAVKTRPDFVLLCVPREAVSVWIRQALDKDLPVLCETPPGRNPEELNDLWKLVTDKKGSVQVAEQYFLQPYYAAIIRLVSENTLGTISNMNMSAVHGYHAVSIFRKVLGVGFENCTICGKRYRFPVTRTRDRAGWHDTGELLLPDRDRVELRFDGGRTAFYDFSDEQYFSPIRSRSWNVQGDRGEIRDTEVFLLNENNQLVRETMRREDDGVYNIDGWSHLWISLGKDRIYENPFAGARMNDDEIAVADVLCRMGTYVRTGTDVYPLREALQDAYLSFCMEEAAAEEKKIVTTYQSWV